jgi:mono/diheme cytochrome c family protein
MTAARRGAWLLAGAVAAAAACGPPTSGKSAQELWSEHCVRCHGEDGSGNPAQRGLDPRIDLLASKLVRGGAKGLIFQRIAYGYAAMPGFAHKLEQGDLELLVDFVLRLDGE